MLSDVELGLLLLSATYVFLSVLGGSLSPIYPLVYALVSFLVTFHPLKTGTLAGRGCAGIRGCHGLRARRRAGAAAAFPGHAGFIAVFAVLNVAFLHAEVARQRREHRKRLEDEVLSMREEARDFRLISPGLTAASRLRTRAEEEEKLSQGSIETIRQQLFHTIELLRHSLGLKTCALLWLDSSGEKLKLKELSTSAHNLAEGALSARAGVFAAVLKEGRPCVLESPQAGRFCPTTRDPRTFRPSWGCPSSRARPCAACWSAIAPPDPPSGAARSSSSPLQRRRSCASCSPSACSRPWSARSTSTSVSTAPPPRSTAR